jgi:hypothetical protein
MSNFAKRHYEAVAEAMQEASPSPKDVTVAYKIRREQWEMVRDQLMLVFIADNPNFKSGRFEHACEYGANVRARS